MWALSPQALQLICEIVFFEHPLALAPDVAHSGAEARYYALGRTPLGRVFFVVFTMRGSLIRVATFCPAACSLHAADEGAGVSRTSEMLMAPLQLERGYQAATNSVGVAMKRSTPASSPDAYVAALSGWQRGCVQELRATVCAATRFDEVIKWGNLVYLARGPVLMIRAETERVLIGFWRGQRLWELESRLRPGGKYEMATIELRRDALIAPATVRRLAAAAARLNQTLGDPTQLGGPT